jgi:hypothetical protein
MIRARESFAHMSSGMFDWFTREKIKEYFPKSWQVFEKMIKEEADKL